MKLKILFSLLLLIALSRLPSSVDAAQLASVLPDVVGQARAKLTPLLDLACTDKSRIISFRKGAKVAETKYESIVASARSGGDRLTAYSERLVVNGQPAVSNSNISPGATFSDHRFQILQNQTNFLSFNTGQASNNPNDRRLVIKFELRKDMQGIPSYLPDFGQLTIESRTLDVIRLEAHYLGRPQSPGPTYQNAESTVIEDFGNTRIDNITLWMPRAMTMEVTSHANKDVRTQYVHEYSDCKKFNVSVTIVPQR